MKRHCHWIWGASDISLNWLMRVVILYHNGNKMVEVPEYAGKYDLLGKEMFDGKVKGYEIKVLLMEGERD